MVCKKCLEKAHLWRCAGCGKELTHGMNMPVSSAGTFCSQECFHRSIIRALYDALFRASVYLPIDPADKQSALNQARAALALVPEDLRQGGTWKMEGE
jgi:surface antigen